MAPHEIMVAHGITFDLGAGIGARVPSRHQEAPAEMLVLMQPSMFLTLATPLAAPRPSLAWIRAQMTAGHAICPPMLRVWLPSVRTGVPGALTWPRCIPMECRYFPVFVTSAGCIWSMASATLALTPSCRPNITACMAIGMIPNSRWNSRRSASNKVVSPAAPRW